MNKQDKVHRPKQLNLKDAETYELASELARLSGDTLSGAVKSALREKLDRTTREATKEKRLARMMAILEPFWALTDNDTRTAEEILGYDENGLPT